LGIIDLIYYMKGVKMKIKRINKNTTIIYYPLITKQRYVRTLYVYTNDDTFNIDTNYPSKRIHKDNKIFRNLLYKTNLLDKIKNNNVFNKIIEI